MQTDQVHFYDAFLKFIFIYSKVKYIKFSIGRNLIFFKQVRNVRSTEDKLTAKEQKNKHVYYKRLNVKRVCSEKWLFYLFKTTKDSSITSNRFQNDICEFSDKRENLANGWQKEMSKFFVLFPQMVWDFELFVYSFLSAEFSLVSSIFYCILIFKTYEISSFLYIYCI